MEEQYEPDFLQDPIREQPLEQSLPHSAEAERAILGGIVIDNGLISQAIELLKPEDFYVPSHRRIFTAMIALFERGGEINPILVGEELKKENALESVGGISFITNLTYGLPHSTNIAHYAKVVRGKSMLRRLIKANDKSNAEAYAQEEEPEIIVARSVKAGFDLTLESTVKSFTRIDKLTHASLTKAYEIQQSGKTLTGIPSGFHDLDTLTLGFQRKDLILLAGRPSMGKTSSAVCMAVNAAKLGYRVAYFSLEQPDDQIAARVLCTEARMDLRKYRGGYINQDEWNRLGQSHEELEGINLYIEDTPAINYVQIKAKAMRLISEHGPLDEIIVDYLGLMDNVEGKRHYSREQEVAQQPKGLRRLAKELNVAMIALCQLNRGPENRTDHRPTLADLRDSGALEQDADVVTFVYRQDQYKHKDEPKDNTAELIIAKQRNGPTDTVGLRFDPPSTRFDNLMQ